MLTGKAYELHIKQLCRVKGCSPQGLRREYRLAAKHCPKYMYKYYIGAVYRTTMFSD